MLKFICHTQKITAHITNHGDILCSIPEAVVVEPAVAGHGEDTTPSWAQRVEDLKTCLTPYLKQQAKSPYFIMSQQKKFIHFSK